MAALLAAAVAFVAVVGSSPASRSNCSPRWRTVSSPKVVGGQIASLAVASPTDVWAVGSIFRPDSAQKFGPSLIEHWDGHSWRRWRTVPGAPGDELRDVAVIAPNDVWAVGLAPFAARSALAEHWDGKSWTLASPLRARSLWAIAGDATDDVWAVGTDDSGLLVLRWDGSAWQRMPAPSAPPSVTNGPMTTCSSLTGVAVLANDDVWVAGEEATGNFQGQALTAHWDGRSWRLVNAPRGIGNLGTFAVVSPTDIWAVTGQSGRGDVMHWDGVHWRAYKHPQMDGPVSDITAVSANDVWLVNPIMHWNGRRWSLVQGPRLNGWLWAIAAASRVDVWAAGSILIEHYSCKQT